MRLIQSSVKRHFEQGAQLSALGPGEMGGAGREVQERGDIGTLTADSHCCTAEANTTL